MSDLRLSTEVDDENPTTGDVMIRDGQLVLVDGPDAIRQEIEIRLSWWRGEWFLNRAAGMPWLELLTAKATAAEVAAVVRLAVASTPGVLEVRSVGCEPDVAERAWLVSFEAAVDGSDRPLVFSDFVIATAERLDL